MEKTYYLRNMRIFMTGEEGKPGGEEGKSSTHEEMAAVGMPTGNNTRRKGVGNSGSIGASGGSDNWERVEEICAWIEEEALLQNRNRAGKP